MVKRIGLDRGSGELSDGVGQGVIVLMGDSSPKQFGSRSRQSRPASLFMVQSPITVTGAFATSTLRGLPRRSIRRHRRVEGSSRRAGVHHSGPFCKPGRTLFNAERSTSTR